MHFHYQKRLVRVRHTREVFSATAEWEISFSNKRPTA